MRYLLLLLCLSLVGPLHAEQIYEFDNPVDRERFQQFNEELRCPQCQNQNLAGSDSIVSESVRQDIYEQILAGRSDKEIIDDMVRRYGNYILYRPPFELATIALWLAPIILLLLGAWVLWRMLSRKSQEARTGELSVDEEHEVEQLLANYRGKQEPKP